MPFVIFATPYFSENALRFVASVAQLEGVQFGLISQQPQEDLPSDLRAHVCAHWRIDDCLNAHQLVWAAQSLAERHGNIDRLFGAVEQMQVPLAEAREQLGIEGMSVEVARNFREKARMKELFFRAGIPCARHRLVASDAEAWAFAEEVGYPLVVKPPAGAASQSTYRADDANGLRDSLRRITPSAHQPVLLEEFITGDEHSWETVSLAGRHLWHSWTNYLPAPLEAMRTPWIQWRVLLPRETDDPYFETIRSIAPRALDALGLQTGLTHLEWFRRPDGRVAISEVGARPPGAQITTLMSRAHDVDFLREWARLMVYGTFNPPQRKYAAGAAFLRGQGRGRVQAVEGWEAVQRELGHLITDARMPHIGQPAGASYEGEGYVLVRHAETQVVEQALLQIVSLMRVTLG